jgi:hypothetical protein
LLLQLFDPVVDGASWWIVSTRRCAKLKKEIRAMKTTRFAGAMLATAVALAFTGSALNAADTQNQSTQAAQIKCLGANACKGQSVCKTATNDCKGKNSCAGKGYIITTDAKSCEGKGGRVGKKTTNGDVA